MTERTEARCSCGRVLFDGQVLKGITIVKVKPGGGCEAKCKFCKKWADVPMVYKEK